MEKNLVQKYGVYWDMEVRLPKPFCPVCKDSLIQIDNTDVTPYRTDFYCERCKSVRPVYSENGQQMSVGKVMTLLGGAVQFNLVSVPYSLYDTVWIPKEDQLDKSKGSGEIYFNCLTMGMTDYSPGAIDNNRVHKTKIDTNGCTPKALPSPQTFEIFNISVSIPYIGNSIKKEELRLLMNNSYFKLYIGNIPQSIFLWNMLDDVSGEYYYKGNYKCYSKLKIKESEVFYSVLCFQESVKFTNNFKVTVSLDGILQREAR